MVVHVERHKSEHCDVERNEPAMIRSWEIILRALSDFYDEKAIQMQVPEIPAKVTSLKSDILHCAHLRTARPY